MTEASATVKGLTGIDVPGLLNNALGANGGVSAAGGSGGGGSGPATRAPRPPRPTGGTAPTTGTGASSTGGAASATGTNGSSGQWPSTNLRPGSDAVSPSAAPASEPAWGATAGAAAPPRFETQEAIDAALADADAALRRAGQTADRALTDTAAGPARPASADINRETTLDDAAIRLANDLRGIPGIERFGSLRLEELDRTGPRPLRTMWRIARDQLSGRYGSMTVGEFIDRSRGPGGAG